MIKYLKYWLGFLSIIQIKDKYYVTMRPLGKKRLYLFIYGGQLTNSTFMHRAELPSFGSATDIRDNYYWLGRVKKNDRKIRVI